MEHINTNVQKTTFSLQIANGVRARREHGQDVVLRDGELGLCSRKTRVFWLAQRDLFQKRTKRCPEQRRSANTDECRPSDPPCSLANAFDPLSAAKKGMYETYYKIIQNPRNYRVLVRETSQTKAGTRDPAGPHPGNAV